MDDNLGEELLENLAEIERQKDTYLIPENIREGVEVLGVTGELIEAIDTSDATATRGDIIAPKTAYVNGEKITGTIEIQQTVIGVGLNYTDATVDTNLTVFDTNLAYNIALLGTFSGTTLYMYEYKNHRLGSQLDAITLSSFGTSGTLLSCAIQQQPNSVTNVNVWAYAHVTGATTADICVIQWDPVNKAFLTDLKTKYNIVHHYAQRHQGHINPNPVYSDVFAVANQMTVSGNSGGFYTSGVVGRYNPATNMIYNVTQYYNARFSNTINGDENYCEWDTTGRYLLCCNKRYSRPSTSIIGGDIAMKDIYYWGSTFTSYSRTSGNTGQYDILCMWNGTYYFYKNELRRLSDNSTVKTYSEYTADPRYNIMWTQMNTLFIVDYTLMTFTAYSINTSTLDITKVYQFYLSSNTQPNKQIPRNSNASCVKSFIIICRNPTIAIQRIL